MLRGIVGVLVRVLYHTRHGTANTVASYFGDPTNHKISL